MTDEKERKEKNEAPEIARNNRQKNILMIVENDHRKTRPPVIFCTCERDFGAFPSDPLVHFLGAIHVENRDRRGMPLEPQLHVQGFCRDGVAAWPKQAVCVAVCGVRGAVLLDGARLYEAGRDGRRFVVAPADGVERLDRLEPASTFLVRTAQK
eukprot:2737768-Rhodomonas_salina.1